MTSRSVKAAFDAKYKIENPYADFYQALAYAKALGPPAGSTRLSRGR